jgi:hypothetical protein
VSNQRHHLGERARYCCSFPPPVASNDLAISNSRNSRSAGRWNKWEGRRIRRSEVMLVIRSRFEHVAWPASSGATRARRVFRALGLQLCKCSLAKRRSREVRMDRARSARRAEAAKRDCAFNGACHHHGQLASLVQCWCASFVLCSSLHAAENTKMKRDCSHLGRALAAAAVLALSVSPVLAKPADRGPTPGLGWAHGHSRGTPAPIAAAGLPALAVAGIFGAYRLRSRRRNERRERGIEAGQP